MKAKFLALAALVLGLASCQTDPQDLDVTSGGEQAVTINVALPEEVTRAAGSDSARGGIGNVNMGEYDIRYILEVYDENGVLAKDRMVQTSDAPSANFDLRLVPGRAYNFVVWADFVTDGTNDLYYDTSAGLRNVQVIDDKWDAIIEARDAYTEVFTVHNFSSTSTINMTLTRPFAKLRVVTDDIDEMISIRPAEVKVTYFNTKFYTTFDAFAEKASGVREDKELTVTLLDAQKNPADVYSQENPNETGVQTLFADYFFGAEDDRVMFYLDVKDNGDRYLPRVTFNTNIPVKRNNLTTVYGPILTDANNVSVTINPAFDNGTNWNPGDDKYDVEVWDGKTLTEPILVDGVYEINTGSQLAWLAAAVSGTLPDTRAVAATSFAGKTFKLTSDINLGENAWKPIGLGGKHFEGIFDGQGHTITGLKVTERFGGDRFALFCSLAGNAQIKNLVIDNAYIKYPGDGEDCYASAIAGTIYGNILFDNIIVKNSTITGNNKVGAIFAHDGSSTQITINNCHVDNCYIASEDLKDGGCVGGLIGYYATGNKNKVNTIKDSSVKNSEIVAINSSNSGKRANSEFIGSIATKDDMVLNIENCVVENNTFSQTTDGQTPVTYVGVFDTKFIGGDRNEALKGKIVINGYETVAQGLGVNEEDEYLVTATEGLEYIAEQVNAGNEEFTDADIVLNGDIDLAELAAMTRSSAVANNWTPIGTEANPFKGSFDGKGKTIKNLALVESEAKEGKAFVGFFGYAKDATIKNVTFENVYINIPCSDIDHSQGHIGAVAGSLEGTSTIENVTVKGDVKVYATQDANGASRVAVIAGGNSYGNVTMKNVHVIANEGSYLIANNNTGALAGQLQGKSVFENCSSNIDVTVNKFFAGGIIGLAAGDQTFTDCHTTGNIAVVAGREGRAHDQYRVGGIAGGWADGAKNVCTLTNCSYTGKVSGKNSDGSVAEPLDYMGYVGRGYTLTNCAGSKVVIDGVEFVQKYNTAAEAGIYDIANLEISSKADMFWFAQMVNSNKCTFAGQTVKLAADIDLNNEEWTPIGSAYMDHGFMGNFDGNGYTIKNLAITEIAADADGYVYAGLFGVTEGTDKDNQNYIKNLVIENVNIATEGHIVAAAIAYPYYTKLENIKVEGNVNIKGGDYTAGVLAYTRRCVDAKNIAITANEGSVIDGQITVGGVISDIQTNGGLTANYSNFKATGLTIKAVQNVGGISGIIGNQILDGAIVKNVAIVSDDTRKGTLAGSFDRVSEIKNAVVENVTGADNYVGGLYKGTESTTASVTINGATYTYNNGWFVDGYQVIANGLLKKDNEYKVINANGLVTLSGITIKGNEVVTLGANIDLTGVTFNGLSAFNPEQKNTFDGKGFTVSNWTNNSGASDMGFIKNWVGPIKNVKFDNCHLKTAGRSAIVAAKVYGNIENVEVKNSSIEDSYWACGIIAGLYNAGSISNCVVTNSSVKSNGGTSAIVGVINETAGERNLTNCSVTDCTINNTGAYGADYSGGALVGKFNCNNTTYTIEGCTVSNNTLMGAHVYEKYPTNENVIEK